MSSSARRPALRVLAFSATALALCVGLSALAPVPWSMPFSWVALALLTLGFVASEVRVLHVGIGKQTRTISLSEVPLLLGLVFAGPLPLLIGKTVGSVAVYVLHRRSNRLKTAVNLLLALAEALLALTVYAAVLSVAGSARGPALWLAGYAATTAACLLSHVVVLSAIALVEGRTPSPLWLVRNSRAPLVTSTMVTTLGLVAVHALHDDVRSGVLLVAVGGVVLAGYRGYADLVERHRALERLHVFSRAVSVTRHPDEVLRSVLEQARELLQAGYACVLLSNEAGEDLIIELGGDGLLVRRTPGPDDDPEDVLAGVPRAGRSLLLRRDESDPRLVRHLAVTGHRDAVVAVLPGPTGASGVLVAADRISDVRSFGKDDVRLLETVAHHAGAALQSGRLLERLQHDAVHDALTGLPNRAALLAAAARAMESGRTVALALLDLDGFKSVNDGLGHEAGDSLLRTTASRLLEALPEGALAARLGGDEFALLLPDAGDEARALSVARSVRIAVAAPLTMHGVTLSIGASMGLALAPEHADDADTLLQNADLALSEARATADLDVRVYSGAPGLNGPERLALAADLREALALGTLQVHVQPKARLQDAEVVGVEALVRWNHPRLGAIGPDLFIPLAEHSGLIVPLTSHVLRTSVAAAASWHRSGEQISIAVNLSPRSLADEKVVDEVLGLLEEHGLPPRLLTLEVTEGSVIAEPERAELILGRLRASGVRLSLDDFGTGYSSLTHLKRLPVHEVKIDRSFVRDMALDDEDAAIVRSIVDLGTNLQLEVVAEGVEDTASWDLLRDLGCDLAQGYHLARPMPADHFPAWLATHRTQGPPAVPAPRASRSGTVVVTSPDGAA